MRHAFSLLELILAIVVIAISVMSLPFIASGAMKGNSAAIVQEMITATKSVISDATTYPWNDNYEIGTYPDKIWRTDGDDTRFSKLTTTEDERLFTSQRQYFGQKNLKCNKDFNETECKFANSIADYNSDCSGMNCLNNKPGSIKVDESGNAASAKHILDLEYTLKVKNAPIDEPTNADTSDEFTVAFGSGSVNADALMVEINSNLKEGSIEGVGEGGVVLKSYNFNIGRAY